MYAFKFKENIHQKCINMLNSQIKLISNNYVYWRNSSLENKNNTFFA
jgi:hypothetical protein